MLWVILLYFYIQKTLSNFKIIRIIKLIDNHSINELISNMGKTIVKWANLRFVNNKKKQY